MPPRTPTFTNTLILTCVAVTLVSTVYPPLKAYGIHPWFIETGVYYQAMIQIVLYSFLHGSFLHLLSNGLFLYVFGNQLEHRMGRKYYMLFFGFATIFIAIWIYLFSSDNTVGISGFAMAMLAYLCTDMYYRRDPEYRAAALFLLINIGLGLAPGISLAGHFGGAVFGVGYWGVMHARELMKLKLDWKK